MGLGRQWLQAVTAAVAICLISKYANENIIWTHSIHLQCICIINFFCFVLVILDNSYGHLLVGSGLSES